MRTRGNLKPWPITKPQRAAMRDAIQQVHHIFEHGTTPQQQAQARAELAALDDPRQPQLPFKAAR